MIMPLFDFLPYLDTEKIEQYKPDKRMDVSNLYLYLIGLSPS